MAMQNKNHLTDLLVIVAHPDDESYGVGGTLAEYSGAGKRTGLITLTRGGSGRTLGLCQPEELPAFREAELRNSVAALGIHDFVQMDYPDAAPASRSTQGAASEPSGFLGGLQNQDLNAMTEAVATEIIRMRPEVVIGFAPDGSNRHPDHIFSNRIMEDALELSGLRDSVRLYYFASPKILRQEWTDTWKPPTHARNVAATLPQKLQAIASHRTQALSTIDFLSKYSERILTETFRAASPTTENPAPELPSQL